MLICRVVGSVVATAKDAGFVGSALLLVQRIDLDGKTQGEPFVASDTVGAGVGETVLISTGSAARTTQQTRSAPTDAAVVGIVDRLNVNEQGRKARGT
jgi:ethanolamine utilization protein EutN